VSIMERDAAMTIFVLSQETHQVALASALSSRSNLKRNSNEFTRRFDFEVQSSAETINRAEFLQSRAVVVPLSLPQRQTFKGI
jgi:hypothetical protein